MPIDRPFQRPKRYIFPNEGVDVNSPPDSPKNPQKALRLKNLTVDSDGSLTPRPGLVDRYAGTPLAGKTPVHSIRRISDPSGDDAIIYGIQDRLANERNSAGALSDVDGAYSGKPLTIIPWRPAQSPKSYAYVYDTDRQRKLAVDQTIAKTIGINQPWKAPEAELTERLWGDVVLLTGSSSGWTSDGSVIGSAPTSHTRIDGATVTITRVVADDIGSGACVQPSDLSDIGKGMHVRHLSSGPTLSDYFVSEVHRGSSATTIDSIVYDDGTTGLCTIYPKVSSEEFRRNALIEIGGATEYVRILETIPGLDGSLSIRCKTANNHSATQSLQVVDSYRAWSAFSGETNVYSYGLVWTNTTSGKGHIQKTGLTNVDLTRIPSIYGSGSTTEPFTDEDYFHISLKCNKWEDVSLIRVLLDVDDGTFEENYYWYPIEQSAILAAAQGEELPSDASRRLLNRNIIGRPIRQQYRDEGPQLPGLGGRIQDRIDGEPPFRAKEPDPVTPDPDDPAAEGGTGKNQWAEIRWKRGHMFRSGSDASKGWDDVKGIRIEVTYENTSVTTYFGSFHVFGGGGPDIGEEGGPYQYRYRYRDSTTGVTSNYSPSSQHGVMAYRNNTTVRVTGVDSAQADKIDIERFGGLQSGWLYVGTVDNPGAGSTADFTDKSADVVAERNAAFSDRNVIQPWIKQQLPIASSGTANVAGSAISLNVSDALSENILPGTLIIIDGIATSLRRPLDTISAGTYLRWELSNSIGTRSSVNWEIPNPQYANQPLGRVFGPFNGAMFACDGTYVRWTFGNDPDATSERNYAEITDPTDVAVGGFVFNGRAGVLTTKRLFSVDGDPVRGFTFTEVPFGKGLFTPYGLAVGPAIAWIARDGIYESSGSTPRNITTQDLAPLFPLEGKPGRDAEGLKAPDIDVSEQQYLRLSYLDDGSLMFTYRDTSGARHHLRYVGGRDGGRWYPYDYVPDIACFYALEGESINGVIAGSADTPAGKVYTVGGTTNPTVDDGTGFDCQVRTFYDDLGDPRSRKYLGDLIIDADPANHTTGIVPTLLTDHGTVSTALTPMTGTARLQQTFDLSSGNGIRARNFGLDMSWTTEAAKSQRLYLYEVALLPRPESTNLRATDYSDVGYTGDKYMQGIRLTADTFGVDKTLRIEYDGGQLGQTLTINHNGLRKENYSFDTPFIARLVRIATADTDSWELYDFEYVYNPEPPAAEEWWIQFTGFDIPGYKHIYQIRPAIAAPANVTMTLYADTQATSYDSQTILATGGSNYTFMRRPTHILPAKKFKLWAAKFTSASPFRLYLRDTEVLVKGWGNGGDYQTSRPFGDQHRTEGARI